MYQGLQYKMKAKILVALTVALLFGFVSLAVYSSRTATADSEVKICPSTGLPCTGSGLCGDGSGNACGGGCCGQVDQSPAGCAGCAGCPGASKCGATKGTEESATPTTENDACANCPNRAAGLCPGKSAVTTESTTEQ